MRTTAPWRRGLGIVVVLAVVLAACAGDDADDAAPSSSRSETSAATDGSDLPLGAPPEVVEHADDWPLPGRDYDNSRARCRLASPGP